MLTAAILRGQTALREDSSLLFSKGVETLFYLLALLQILMGMYLIWHGLQRSEERRVGKEC